MRPVLTAYLVVYYLLIGAAVVTLYRSGLIAHLHGGWTLLVLACAVTLGILLVLLSRE